MFEVLTEQISAQLIVDDASSRFRLEVCAWRTSPFSCITQQNNDQFERKLLTAMHGISRLVPSFPGTHRNGALSVSPFHHISHIQLK